MANIATTCPPLTAPDNGDIDCSLGDDGEANPGDSCDFTCINNFGVVGSASRTCQVDGTWTGTQTSCQTGVLTFLIIIICIKCTMLLTPKKSTAIKNFKLAFI